MAAGHKHYHNGSHISDGFFVANVPKQMGKENGQGSGERKGALKDYSG